MATEKEERLLPREIFREEGWNNKHNQAFKLSVSRIVNVQHPPYEISDCALQWAFEEWTGDLDVVEPREDEHTKFFHEFVAIFNEFWCLNIGYYLHQFL